MFIKNVLSKLERFVRTWALLVFQATESDLFIMIHNSYAVLCTHEKNFKAVMLINAYCV